MRLWRKRSVKSDEIGVLQEIAEIVDQLDLQGARAAGGEVGIEGEHAHAEGDGAPAEFTPDAAHADDAERFVVKLHALEFLSTPFLVSDGGVGLGNFARGAEEEREGVLGGGNGVAAGSVHYDHAAFGCRLDVDVIDPDTGAADHSQLAARLQHGSGDLGFAADDDGAEVWNRVR